MQRVKKLTPFWLFGILFLCQNCATPISTVKPVTSEERVRLTQAIGHELAHRFESTLLFRKDPDVERYLRDLALTIVSETSELKGTDVQVLLIRDHASRWESFAIPEVRIYLPIGLLRDLKYENEVAAVLAIQLGHILSNSLLNHLKMKIKLEGAESKNTFDSLLEEMSHTFFPRIEFYGENGLFKFTEDEQTTAIQSAVGILYRAGIDPRGIISLFSLYQANPRYSPYEGILIDKWIEITHREISKVAPLRNPVVRSLEFLKMQKRMQRL